MEKSVALLLLTVALIVATSCGQGSGPTASQLNDSPSPQAGDSTLYGLACDGCNDTVLVYLPLPYDDRDPDTLNILEASRQGHVYGQLRIGDKLVIVRNSQDTAVADMVVSTNALQGEWCFRVKPTLRLRPDGSHLQLNDSLRRLLEVEREYGFIIKPDSQVFPKGFGGAARTSDDASDIVYPAPRRYRRWAVSNGRLLLSEAIIDSVGTVKTMTVDTASFVRLTADTLVLRFCDGEHEYYRKAEEAAE